MREVLAGGSAIGRPRADALIGQSAGSISSIGAVSTSRRTTFIDIVRTMRPGQWIKNLLVFVAPAAAGVLDRRLEFLQALATFGIFCAVASGAYLVNDALDAEADRRHPEKRCRPIARGALSSRLAVGVGVSFMATALLSAGFVAGRELVLVIGTYMVISVAYSVRLKRQPVIELAAVASGFVLRAIAGGVAVHVPLSNWFLVVTSFGALFVVTGKRSAEHTRLGERRAQHRAVLAEYTSSFLQSTLVLTASVTVTAYCLWAFERGGLLSRAGHHFVWIQLSVVPVILGVLCVLRLIDAGKGGVPEDLALHNRLLQGLALVWLVLFSIGLYG